MGSAGRAACWARSLPPGSVDAADSARPCMCQHASQCRGRSAAARASTPGVTSKVSVEGGPLLHALARRV
eukprot:365086-Chlamydomonas_euryale.AAC.17